MRQVRALALMMTGLLLIASCAGPGNGPGNLGGGPERCAEDVKKEFTNATKLETVVKVRADYGDRVYDFKLKYTGGTDAGELTIMEPESVAGLSAQVSVSGVTLKYDGAELDTGAVTGAGLSPAGAIPALLREWTRAYVVISNFEKLLDTQALAIMSDITEHVSQKTWFDVKALLPLRAEISQDGRTILFCEFEDFILE